MAEAWYNQPEARALLDNLTHQDLTITMVNDHFVWDIPSSIDARLEFWIEKTVDTQLGFTLDETKDDIDREERWLSFYEGQATVNDMLIQRFGDPDKLFPYGLDRANSIWKKDPLVLIRKKRPHTMIRKK